MFFSVTELHSMLSSFQLLITLKEVNNVLMTFKRVLHVVSTYRCMFDIGRALKVRRMVHVVFAE